MGTTENYTVRILERLKAAGSREVIIAEDRRISGTEAVGLVLRFATVLRDTGLRSGDGVALFVQNSPEALLISLAVHMIGCRLVFVPPEPGNSELEAYIRRAEVAALLFDPVFEDRARSLTGRVNVPNVFSHPRHARTWIPGRPPPGTPPGQGGRGKPLPKYEDHDLRLEFIRANKLLRKHNALSSPAPVSELSCQPDILLSPFAGFADPPVGRR